MDMTCQSDKKLIQLWQEMSQHTLSECTHTCRLPLSCCSPEYCLMAKDYAKEEWGISLSSTGNEQLPFMGEDGCVVPPHLRPLCTLHTCQIHAIGIKPGDPQWTQKYFCLRDEIEEMCYLREKK